MNKREVKVGPLPNRKNRETRRLSSKNEDDPAAKRRTLVFVVKNNK